MAYKQVYVYEHTTKACCNISMHNMRWKHSKMKGNVQSILSKHA